MGNQPAGATPVLWLYRTLFLPALALALPRYVWRMVRRGGYARHFGQRFGRYPNLPAKREGQKRLWIQAVSVGEVLAVGPLLEALACEGKFELLLTTTTSTGYALAESRYRQIAHVAYFPLDWWWFSRSAWEMIQADAALLLEGELWPEHVHQAQARGVPVLLVNARLSDRSFGRMRRVAPMARGLLRPLSRILAASRQDEDRFRSLLGGASAGLRLTGNLKLDLSLAPLSAEARERLLRELGLGGGRMILLGASTWPGEEEALLAALRLLHQQGSPCALLLVPRHAERRGEVKRLLEESGRPFHLRSIGAAPSPVEIAVGDTTGELRAFLQLADLVFIGKSLSPNRGGQTPIEAAVHGRPMLFGPNMGNFREIAAALTAQGAARIVHSSGELGEAAAELMADPAARHKMSEAALAWSAANQGAVQRTVSAVLEALARPAVDEPRSRP